MAAGSAKQKVLEVIEKLPADATLEDAIERLVLLAKTERGAGGIGCWAGHRSHRGEASTSPVTRIVWAPQAIQDVEAIYAHIAGDSTHYADLVVERGRDQ